MRELASGNASRERIGLERHRLAAHPHRHRLRERAALSSSASPLRPVMAAISALPRGVVESAGPPRLPTAAAAAIPSARVPSAEARRRRRA